MGKLTSQQTVFNGFLGLRFLTAGLTVLIGLCGCSPNDNKNDRKMATIDSVAVHHEVSKANQMKPSDTTARNDSISYEKLSCNQLMVSLIKTSSIDKNLLLLSDDERIDSIKNSTIYMTMYHKNNENGSRSIGYLTFNIEKRELGVLDLDADTMKRLVVNPKLLELIVRKDCYREWVKDYGNNSDD
jgi:hypothetical protein